MKIEARHLSANVHRTSLLRNISIRVERGELIGLIGPNGSGKSTLMRCFAGLRRPSAGCVLADGADLTRMPARLRARRIAFVEQQADTTDRLSVRDAVNLGRTPYLSPLRGWNSTDDAAVEAALDAVEMTAFADRLWHTLSGGERQRIIALHDLNQAAACDRIGVLSAGKLVAMGRPQDVLGETLLAEVFGVAAMRHKTPDGASRLHFSHAI